MPHAKEQHHLLITAGPTQEPIDEVRFISNRSSGRLGVEIAHAAAEAGWSVTLLLGPCAMQPADTRIRVIRFRTAADLRQQRPRLGLSGGGARPGRHGGDQCA